MSDTAPETSNDVAPEDQAEKDRARIAELEAQLAERDAAAVVAPESPKARKLSEYKNGDQIEVVKDGDWKAGFVTGVEKKLGLVYVHTDRGPVTVANAINIRLRQN